MRTPTGLGADLNIDRWDDAIARRVLAAWQASGTSLAAFARQHGVHAQRLSWWRRRLDGQGKLERSSMALPSFVPVIAMPPETPAVAVAVRLPGGVAVEATSVEALPVRWVATLARALRAGT